MFGKKSPTSSDKFALTPVEKDDGSLEIPPDPLKRGQDDSLYTPTAAKAQQERQGRVIKRRRRKLPPRFLDSMPSAKCSIGAGATPL